MKFISITWLALAAILATGCGFADRQPFHGTFLDPPMENDGFELQSSDGAVRSDDCRGRWSLLFFGYTNCPDVCPATLSVLSRALDGLDDEQVAKIRVLFVSVDPARDDPATVERYAGSFGPAFVGLTGSEEQIERAASSFGINHAIVEGSAESGYLVDHTASTLLLDPEGRTRMVWSFGVGADEITADLRRLVGS